MEFKAVLGLGNTGSKYKNTYHNIGQLMVDFLLENDALPENVIIAKNEGFMNHYMDYGQKKRRQNYN